MSEFIILLSLTNNICFNLHENHSTTLSILNAFEAK